MIDSYFYRGESEDLMDWHKTLQGKIDQFGVKKFLSGVSNQDPQEDDEAALAMLKTWNFKVDTRSHAEIRNAYYIGLVAKTFNLDISTLSHVTDCGGGHGMLASLFKKMNYTGDYSIIDLPPMHKIQKQFLTDTVGDYRGIKFTGTADAIIPSSNSLFISAFSLCEFPLRDRASLHESMMAHDYLLFHYYPMFGYFNNNSYFEKLKNQLSATHIVTEPKGLFCSTKFIAHDPASKYISAKRKTLI